MKDFSAPVSQRAVMNVSFKRMGILTTSASTIESPIICNTLTLLSNELPPRSAIVRVSIVTSRLPPIFLPIPVRETIVLAWVCISEFPTRTSDLSI
ncbi:hypothetical protein TNCV_4788711 [Trichonephila clavipes]|nr:hypothetical protein TNCV_4788711 [Trichonephila clavipes]